MSTISRSEISRLRSLRSARERKLERQFIAEGTKLLAELERSDYEIDRVYCTEDYGMEGKERLGGRLVVISEKAMERISPMATPPGILAVVNIPDEKPLSFDPGLILMLDRISDPGNMGTILRNADWFGVDRLICMENCVDVYNPKVVQASMGSLFRLDIVYRPINELRNELPSDFKVILAEKGGTPVGEFSFPSKSILVIGSESHGVGNSVRDLASESISIPGESGRAESLNAAVASGILLSAFYNI